MPEGRAVTDHRQTDRPPEVLFGSFSHRERTITPFGLPRFSKPPQWNSAFRIQKEPLSRLKSSTKSMICRLSKKVARQGVKAANEGVYTDVNDRICSRRQRRKQKFRLLARISAVAAFFDGLSRFRGSF